MTYLYFQKIEEPFMLAVRETLDQRCNVALELSYRKTIKFILDCLANGYDKYANDS